jgi:hypothetical protein
LRSLDKRQRAWSKWILAVVWKILKEVPMGLKSVIPVLIPEETHELDYSGTAASMSLLLEENELSTKYFASRQKFR